MKKYRVKPTADEHSALKSLPIFADIHRNNRKIREILGNSQDILMREFVIKLVEGGEINGLALAIDGLIDDHILKDEVLKPLMKEPLNSPGKDLEQIRQRIYGKELKVEGDLRQGIQKALNGGVLLLFNGYDLGFTVSIEKFRLRSPEEPPSEMAIKGSREGFIESVGANIALIRRRIRNPGLRFETFNTGAFSGTTVVIGYVSGIVQPEFLDRVRRRLRQIRVDAFQGAGQIEQYLEDNPFTLFPTIGNTERPDRAAMALMEGRILLMAEGSPVTLFVPYLFIDAFKNVEDYNSRPYYTSFVRCLRSVSFLISILLPSLFVGALNFHKAMIPSEFITSIENAREKVPFPLVMEVIIMVVLFEIVREAGIRMPQQIGQALSIVGALILGQVSVQAGLISAPTIIAVSLAAIATFMVTPVTDVVSVLRFALILPTSMLGFFGLIMALLGVLIHAVTLTSLGEPYLAPLAPVRFKDWRDMLIRIPLIWMKKRPQSIPHVRPTKVEKIPPKRKPFFMRNIFRYCAAAVMMLLLPLLTGCWSSLDLKDTAIVMGTGFDKTDTGYRISVQMLRPGSSGDSDSSADTSGNNIVLERNAESLFSFARDFIRDTKRRLVFTHNRIWVVKDSLAQDNIVNILDTLQRDEMPRLNSFLFITPDNPVEVLKTPALFKELSSMEIYSGIQSVKYISDYSASDIREVLRMLTEPPYTSYLPMMHISESAGMKVTEIDGTAIVKDHHMIGKLDTNETMGLLWLRNKVKETAVSVPNGHKHPIQIETRGLGTRITPLLQGDKLSVHVNIRLKGTIAEIPPDADVTGEFVNHLEKRISHTAEGQIHAALNKLQNQYHADITGIGLKVYRKYPKQWHDISNRWDDIFSKANITVDVNAKVYHPGLIHQTLNHHLSKPEFNPFAFHSHME